MDASYDRPTKATLIVRLANGEEWEATPEDLAKFRLVTRNDAYMGFRRALENVLTNHGLLDYDSSEYREITDAELNPLRYFVETAVCYPDLLDHTEHEAWQSVANLERRLRGLPVVEGADEEATPSTTLAG
jgi:hypothetical protein